MRKPEDKLGALERRDTLWQAIRTAKEFSLLDLLHKSALDKSTVSGYLKSLVQAGYLTISGSRVKSGRTQPVYRLIKDSLEPPRVRKDGTEVTQGVGRRLMWNVMRISKVFTMSDLLAKSSLPEHPVAFQEAETYISYLERAGYLRNTDGKQRPRALYRLIRNTGPKPPMIQRVHQVYDPNVRKVVWPVEGSSK